MDKIYQFIECSEEVEIRSTCRFFCSRSLGNSLNVISDSLMTLPLLRTGFFAILPKKSVEGIVQRIYSFLEYSEETEMMCVSKFFKIQNKKEDSFIKEEEIR